MRDESKRQTIQGQLAVTASFDPPGAHPVAEALRRARLEFTGTSIVAVAGLQIIRFEGPFHFFAVAHKLLLSFRRFGLLILRAMILDSLSNANPDEDAGG